MREHSNSRVHLCVLLGTLVAKHERSVSTQQISYHTVASLAVTYDFDKRGMMDFDDASVAASVASTGSSVVTFGSTTYSTAKGTVRHRQSWTSAPAKSSLKREGRYTPRRASTGEYSFDDGSSSGSVTATTVGSSVSGSLTLSSDGTTFRYRPCPTARPPTENEGRRSKAKNRCRRKTLCGDQLKLMQMASGEDTLVAAEEMAPAAMSAAELSDGEEGVEQTQTYQLASDPIPEENEEKKKDGDSIEVYEKLPIDSISLNPQPRPSTTTGSKPSKPDKSSKSCKGPKTQPGDETVSSRPSSEPTKKRREGAKSTNSTKKTGSKITKKKSNLAEDPKKNRLTATSAVYDLDGDGVLDQVERAMMERDTDGDGRLDHSEVYKIVQDQLRSREDARMYRRVIIGLACLVAFLAASNFGTSWATAVLSKEVNADSASGTIQSKETGEVMGLQSVTYEFRLESLLPEEFERRRELVDSDLEEDSSHEDHLHRRLGRNEKLEPNRCNCRKLAYDHRKVSERDLREISRRCKGGNTVTLKRRWKARDGSIAEEVDQICGPGTVVAVQKKKKSKRRESKTKVRGTNQRIKFRSADEDGASREVSFDCEGGVWLVARLSNQLLKPRE